MTNLPALPACVTDMGCLCARHAAQGFIMANEPCNASEDPADWPAAVTVPSDVAFLASIPAAIDLENGRDASGSRCHTPADVVIAIRRDLKLAVKAGLIPAHAKFSVTRDGKSINVDLTAWQGQVLVAEYIEVCMEAFVAGKDGPSADAEDPFMTNVGRARRREQSQDGRLTDEINAVMWLVERLVDRHNYDNSDTMTDYFDTGYYSHVSARGLISAAMRGVKLECNPAAQELLARAHAAAKRVGPKVVRSVCGKGGVENCSEYQIGRLLKLDARANGRPLVYNNGRGWVVDTSAPIPVKPATPETN